MLIHTVNRGDGEGMQVQCTLQETQKIYGLFTERVKRQSLIKSEQP